MKTLLIGTIAVVFATTINLSAQNIQSTSTADQNAPTITQTAGQAGKFNNNQGLNGQKLQNRQNNRSQFNEVCDGTQKRLHQQINANQCDGSGRKGNKRGRR